MMGFVGWVLGYLWLLCAMYLAGKAVGWLILRGGIRRVAAMLSQWVDMVIFLYWEYPLRLITGRPNHARVLSKIEKLENDLGYRDELISDPERLAGSTEDVIWFQNAHGLVPDGVIGPKTLAVAEMIDRKRSLAGQMIPAREMIDYEQTKAIMNRELIEAARNFTVTTTADRPDFDHFGFEYIFEVRSQRIRRNGS